MGETDTDMKKNVEAILFAAGRTVTQEEIENILNMSTPGLVKEIVKELKSEYDSRDSPILLIEEGEGWKLTVKEGYLPVVQKINPHTEFSKAVMETLAVIAWKQPITQAKVVDIRTNKAYDHIKELVELGFISKEKYGRSFMLKPTQKFLDYFDLPDQAAAKKIFKDFKDEDLQKKITEMKKDGGEGKEAEAAEHLGELDVYDAGTEADTYADRQALAAEEKRRSGKLGDLDVYEEAPGTAKEEEKPEETEEAETEEDEEKPAEEAPEEELSEEEKAKRIARELLEEDEPKKEEEEEIEKRELHPELEEYLKEGAEEEPQEAEEKPAEEVPEEKEETGEEAGEKPEEEAGEETGQAEEEPEEKEESEEDKDYEAKRKALEEEEMKKAAGEPAPAEESEETGETEEEKPEEQQQ